MVRSYARRDPSLPRGVRGRLASLRLGTVALTVAGLLVTSSRPLQAADTWSTPYPGVRHLYRTTSSPNWRIHALFVDLCERGVVPRATRSSEGPARTSTFGSAVGAEVAINGDFYDTSNYDPQGLAIGNGEHWSDDVSWRGAALFGPYRVELEGSGMHDPPEGWIRQAVGGRPAVVEDGVAVTSFSASVCADRHPRTATGLTADKQTFIMAVVDGRSTASVGMTCAELGTLMRGLGAHQALNMDGGGSTTMWIRGQGVVNNPSDGSERTVGNHLAMLASGSGPPASCDFSVNEVVLQPSVLQHGGFSDVDGDGTADACARGIHGLQCLPSTGNGFGSPIALEEISDDHGWDDITNYATVRTGDVNGDGLADVCARGNALVMCWPSTGTGFGPRIDGPALSDDNGWDAIGYYSTLRLADVTGDGMDDLCARSASDFRCYPSTGNSFGEAIIGPELSNAAGWNAPDHWGTIRMGDIDGDGLSDVCARGNALVSCWPSTGSGFGDSVDGPAWSDDAGWNELSHWSTIRLVDVDGDGRADLCGRSSTNFTCHLSTGDGFGPAVIGPAMADDSGWADHSNYATIRMGDIDADGAADLCARANAGIRCWRWEGAGFSDPIVGPELSDDAGWNDHRYYSTLRLADVNGDRRFDLCARGIHGLFCWLSDGAGFPTEVDGPDWTDDAGWDGLPYYSTIQIGGPRCRPELCNGRDDDCDGDVDEDCGAPPDAGVGGVGGLGAGGSATATGGAGTAPAGLQGADEEGGCGCSAPGRGSGRAWLSALLCVGVLRRRSRERRA